MNSQPPLKFPKVCLQLSFQISADGSFVNIKITLTIHLVHLTLPVIETLTSKMSQASKRIWKKVVTGFVIIFAVDFFLQNRIFLWNKHNLKLSKLYLPSPQIAEKRRSTLCGFGSLAVFLSFMYTSSYFQHWFLPPS